MAQLLVFHQTPPAPNKNKDKNGMKKFQGNLLHIKKPLSDLEGV